MSFSAGLKRKILQNRPTPLQTESQTTILFFILLRKFSKCNGKSSGYGFPLIAPKTIGITPFSKPFI